MNSSREAFIVKKLLTKPGDLLSPEESKRREEQALIEWQQEERAGFSDLTTIRTPHPFPSCPHPRLKCCAALATKVALCLFVNYQARKDNLPMDDRNVQNITQLRFHTKIMKRWRKLLLWLDVVWE